jgi:hypothetical protein
MSPENFVYWLQGFLELTDEKELHEHQIDLIRSHIKLVLDKKTPEKESLTKGNRSVPK